MDKIVKTYSNSDISVVWKPDLCCHSEICFRNLPRVFNPKRRPWIKVEEAETKRIIEVVEMCPTGALSYVDLKNSQVSENTTVNTVLKLVKDGPIMVSGNFKIVDSEGNELEIMKKVALCRCGASDKMPFCDGKHLKVKSEKLKVKN